MRRPKSPEQVAAEQEMALKQKGLHPDQIAAKAGQGVTPGDQPPGPDDAAPPGKPGDDAKGKPPLPPVGKPPTPAKTKGGGLMATLRDKLRNARKGPAR